jgi:hypothetical protein
VSIRKGSNAMTTITTPSSLALAPSLKTAWQDVDSSFARFCLTAGIGAISIYAQRIFPSFVVAEAASATAGAGPRERSASMVRAFYQRQDDPSGHGPSAREKHLGALYGRLDVRGRPAGD